MLSVVAFEKVNVPLNGINGVVELTTEVSADWTRAIGEKVPVRVT